MIEFKTYKDIPKDFTGVCQTIGNNKVIRYFLNGLCHREDGHATEYDSGKKHWFYKGKYYGCNDEFTEETWKEKVEQLKREEELKIFK